MNVTEGHREEKDSTLHRRETIEECHVELKLVDIKGRKCPC